MDNDSVDSLPQKRVLTTDHDPANSRSVNTQLSLDHTFNESMDVSTSSIPENQTPDTSSSAAVAETPHLLRTSDFNDRTVFSSSSNDLSPLQFIDSPGRSKYHSGIDCNIDMNSYITNEHPFRPVSPLPHSFIKSVQSNYIDSFIDRDNSNNNNSGIINKNKNILGQKQKLGQNTNMPDTFFDKSNIASSLGAANNNNNKINNLSVFTNIDSSVHNYSSVSVPSSPTTPISPTNNKTSNNLHSNNLRKFLFKKASFSKLIPNSSQQIPSPTNKSFANSTLSLISNSNSSSTSNNKNNFPDSYSPSHAHSQSIISATSSGCSVNDNNSMITSALNTNNSNGISRLRNVRSLPQLRRLNLIVNLPNNSNNNAVNKASQPKSNSSNMHKESQQNNNNNNRNENSLKVELSLQQPVNSKDQNIETKEFIDYTTFAKFTAVSCNKTSTTNNLHKLNTKISKKSSTSPIPRNTIVSHINDSEDLQNVNDGDLSESSSSSIGSSSVISLNIQNQTCSLPVDPVPQIFPQSVSMLTYLNHIPPKSAGSSIALSITSSTNNNNINNNGGHQLNNNSISSSGKMSIGGNSSISHAPSFARRLVKKASSSSLIRHITSSNLSSQPHTMQLHSINNNGNKKLPPTLQVCTSESPYISDKTTVHSPGFSVSSSKNFTIDNGLSNIETSNVSSPVILVSGLRTPIDGSFSKLITSSIPANKNGNITNVSTFPQSKFIFSDKDTQKHDTTESVSIGETETDEEEKEINENPSSEASSIYEGDTDFEGDSESNSDAECVRSKGDLIYESDTSKELDKINQELRNAMLQQIAENSAFEVTKTRLEESGWYSKEQLDEMLRRQNMINQMWDKKISALQERYQMLLVLQEQQDSSQPEVQRKSEKKKGTNKKNGKKKGIGKKINKQKEKKKPIANSCDDSKDEQHIATIINQQNNSNKRLPASDATSASGTPSIIGDGMILESYRYNHNGTNIASNQQDDGKPASSTAVKSGPKSSNQILLADEDEEDLILRSRSATLVSSRTAHTYHSASTNQYLSVNNPGNSFDEKLEANLVELENANATQGIDEPKNDKNIVHEEDYVDPSERFEFEMN